VSASFDVWEKKVSQASLSPEATNAASSSVRDYVIKTLRVDLQRVLLITKRSRPIREKVAIQASIPQLAQTEALLAHLKRSYVGPGNFRSTGPRHDNDHSEITDIKIAPTQQELLCPDVPFLPANIPGAPHPYGSDSMERLMDVQFRLLREELV